MAISAHKGVRGDAAENQPYNALEGEIQAYAIAARWEHRRKTAKFPK